MEVALGVEEYLPATHPVHSELPAAENCPAAQSMQDVYEHIGGRISHTCGASADSQPYLAVTIMSPSGEIATALKGM
jgi:hypothetical protein